MDKDIFDTLPEFLRRYIEGRRWREFRDIQRRAFDVLFNSENHLLISAGTSSGKTEAALFPVITEIHRSKPTRISALYISPLIALIDDQNERVSKMLRDSDINLYSLHGGISSSLKRKVMESGEGILQITPESLETIVNKHYSKVHDMFSDLRFIIIDEVHKSAGACRHFLCNKKRLTFHK